MNKISKEEFYDKWELKGIFEDIPEDVGNSSEFLQDIELLEKTIINSVKEDCAKIVDNHIIITEPEDVALRTILNINRNEISKAIRDKI